MRSVRRWADLRLRVRLLRRRLLGGRLLALRLLLAVDLALVADADRKEHKV